jgi:hypothetical protein
METAIPCSSAGPGVRFVGVVLMTLIVPLIVTVPVARMTVPVGTDIVPLTVRFVNCRLPVGGFVLQLSPIVVVSAPSDPSP